MIIKPRRYPLSIKKLEALQRRILLGHSKFELIKESLAKRIAGYKGEQSLDYQLGFLVEKQYHILHDVRLFDGTHYFQLDTLILSKKFILILEVKNIAGTLYFDSNFSQLLRIQDEKKESFPDPILQVERQSDQLRKWLRLAKHKNLPVESLVVISTPRTILETAPQNEKIYQKVLHVAKLPFVISSFELVYDRNFLNEKQLLQLSKKLVSNHIPLNNDLLSQYKISKAEIIKGVICTNCQWVPIGRGRGKWICPKCSFVSKDAHLSALEDYSLLIDSKITNQKMREFLNIPSTSVANKLLVSMKLESTGTKKGKIYFLNGN